MTIMDALEGESRSTQNADGRTQQGERGLLLSRDLIFTTKITQTAAALGRQIAVASDAASARSFIEASRPPVVFVDLTAGEVVSPPAVRRYVELAGTDTWFVAFGPHVEADALAAAKSAGCQVVLPRSKFAAELPALLERYFSARPAERG
jgi:hypothetical protein